jgi:hypothetical protein
MPSEYPSCAEVFADKRLSRVCTIFCCAYRKDRPAGDNRHCSQQVLVISGKLNHCLRTMSNLKDSILWVDQNKGATR